MRVTDNIGRIGGEEFLFISIETNIDKAPALAERIRSKIENLKHPHQTDVPVTISIGLAQLGHQTSLDELIAHANEALYQSKNNAMNRVTIYQSAES